MNYTDILVYIRKIVRSVNLESKRIQKKYEVSIPQLLVLGFLVEQDNYQASHAQVAKFLTLNPSTATGILQRMEKKGWIARLPHPKDRRAVMVAITIKGLELQRKTPSLLHEKITSRLKMASNEKIVELKQAFETIINFLSIDDVDASPIITGGTDIPDNTQY